ncbi:hypothetical protein ABNN70_04185 [Sporolactobacillus sp. Y61]|uniref:PepSY domain-containing protein n=1 Tax=Sporolactobacillus sp. Y61 TaxID=3160863 RepID=A0AAU8IHQ8_9BACL
MKKIIIVLSVAAMLMLSACAADTQTRDGESATGDQTSSTVKSSSSEGISSDRSASSDTSSADQSVATDASSSEEQTAAPSEGESVSSGSGESEKQNALEAVVQAAGYTLDQVYAEVQDDGAFYSIELRENHSDDPAADPSTAPSIGFFRYDKDSGRVTKLDIVSNEYKELTH